MSTSVVDGYTPLQRRLELASIAAFGTLALVTAAMVTQHMRLSPVAWHVNAAVGSAAWLCGLLAADFASGLVHWAADNWGSATWPVLGPGFIRPFRHHHIDAEDIARHGFVELNGNNCLVSLPLFGLAQHALHGMDAGGLFWGTFWLSLAVWVFATNQFHAWAHMPQAPRVVRWLQRKRIILNVEHHAQHHARPHNCHYCITTGWLNKPLERLGFFTLLEAIITKVSGTQPVHRQMGEPSPVR